jgi:hypothetical protein
MSKRRKARKSAYPQFYDRKVIRSGFGATISVGKILPKNWRYVRLWLLEQEKDYVLIRIDRLLENHDYAPSRKASQAGE